MKTIATIKIEELVFPDKEDPALKNIDFEINRGDFIVITGGVASGKSALLNTLTGAIPQYYNAELKGQVTIQGKDIKDISLNRMSDYLGYMMQEPQNQIISTNIYEDVSFGLGNMEFSVAEIDQKVKSVLEFVGLKGYEKRKTDALSGGQAQRVVLAGVLALNAPLLILDQPTAELDPLGRDEIYRQLGELNKTWNLTIVMVMDRIEEVINYANRVLCMANGEIIKEYSPKAYYHKQKEYIQNKLNCSNPSKVDAGRSNKVIAEVARVSYEYKNNIKACEDVDLKIYQGDFMAVIGLNGSGKSTLAKMLIGLLKPTSGELKVFNQPVIKENLAKIRAHTGFLFQNPDYQIFASTLEEEVGFSLKLRSEAKEVMEQKIDDCLKFVGLFEYKAMHPQRLSRGQRQLLALASILVSEPDFIIADEPTTGLDENQGYLIMEKLADLSKSGKTILVITHDLMMARHYSNRLVAMHNRRVAVDILTKDIGQNLDSLKEIGLDFENTVL